MPTFEVTSPYDGARITSIEESEARDVEKALSEACALFDDPDKRLPKHQRIEILRNFRALIEQKSMELATGAAREGGKPLADSIVEVKRAVNGVDVAISELMALGGEEIPMGMTPASAGHMAYTVVEPAGVVLALSAFNHPVNLIIHQVVPAVAVGCPVIVKPARKTPLSCFSLVELLYEAGLPRQWCTPLVCSNELAAKMASDPRIAFVSFIGSSKVGWRIRSSLAPGVRCALEHGGAAPVILHSDADLDSALPGLLKAGYYHAGQVCVSVQRLYVHRDIMPEVSQRLTEMVKALKVGDPMSEDTEVGPLIEPSQVDRVHQWVTEAVGQGAQLLCGGKKISDTCYEPTLLLNPPEDSRVTREEIFGPVVCLYEYEDYQEAIGRANALSFVFQAAVYTRDLDRALDCVKRLKATAVMVNQHTAFRVDWMPFGGAGDSGLGMGGIGYSMRDMCAKKMVVIKSPSID